MLLLITFTILLLFLIGLFFKTYVFGVDNDIIGKYYENTFSYHERGLSKKPNDYPQSPKIQETSYPD